MRFFNEDTITKEKTDVQLQVGAASMRLISFGLAVFMLVLIAGCGKTESEEPEESDGGAETTVKLLDAGAEPRMALRYKFQANRTEKTVMETSMAITIQTGEQKQPETQIPVSQMTMKIDGKEVSPEGDLHYEFEIEKTEVLPRPGVNPVTLNTMKQQLNSMLGMSGSATVTSRGLTKDAEIMLPPEINPQIKQSIDNMKQSMNQMSAPLPEEPIGQGARWQVTMPIETPAMNLTQVATYTLSEIQSDKVKLDVTITQSAHPQEIHAPGAAPDTKALLESLNSTGEATIEIQMTSLLPTSSLNMTSTYVISVNEQKIKTTMQLGLKIHPGH
jgi:hypothetical protein